MLSSMQDVPLLVSRMLTHGSTVFGDATVSTWAGEGVEPHRRSYAETGARAARLAHALRDELGVAVDDRVATLMWNNADHLEAYFAVPSMGAILHTLNLRLPPDQLAWIVNHAEDRVIIVNETLVPLLAPLLPRLESVAHIVVSGGGGAGDGTAQGAREALAGARARVHDYEELLSGRPDRYEWPELDERQAAALCYTSGTTGEPKGVTYSHRSLYLHALQVNTVEVFGLSDTSRVLSIVPMFHVNAWGIPFSAFFSGASLLMPDRFLQPGPIAEMLESERPTFAAGVPTIWSGLLAELETNPRDLSSVRLLVSGGSACPPALMRAYEEKWGVPLVEAWGMTETSPLGCVAHPPAGVEGEERWNYRHTTGRLHGSIEARLTGPNGERIPWDGESSGELEVRGPWIAGSYYGGAHGDPLRPDDKFTEDGWLRTGDIGHITPGGYLTLTDRAKDVIKSGGEWISSVELENALMAHEAVAEAAVVAVPDERWGERPLAAVVLGEDAEAVTYRELSAFLGERLARWQLPERWTRISAVPKTSVGKFDKKVLRGQYAAGELDVTLLSA